MASPLVLSLMGLLPNNCSLSCGCCPCWGILNLIFLCFEGKPKQLEEKMVQKLQEDVAMEEDS